MEDDPGRSFVCATHDALFEAEAPACDACGAPVPDPRSEGDGYEVPGSGLYVWTRGDEVRREEPPLCPTCAGAIGMSALARWEIEEEEG